jgi:hypothetical protein
MVHFNDVHEADLQPFARFPHVGNFSYLKAISALLFVCLDDSLQGLFGTRCSNDLTGGFIFLSTRDRPNLAR